jgi:Ser/Thr protein kinase RdoA (MazF antagonist)
MTIPVSHSIATPDAIAELVSARWDVGDVAACLLVRSFANDVYRVETTGGRFAVKVYRLGWRNRWDAAWEAELCQHLAQRGVALAMPIAGMDRREVQVVRFPEGDRAVVLTPWLPGGKPEGTRTEQLYERFGQAAAALHLATQDFVPSIPGRLLGADHLIRRPFAKLQDALAGTAHDLRAVAGIAEQVAAELDRLTPELPFGVCHGDLTLDNLHIDDGGAIALFDFDLGGHGWFAYDFNGIWRWSTLADAAIPLWQAFRRGYSNVRPITPAEDVAVPLFDLAYLFWDLEHTVNTWTAWSGTWRAPVDEIDGKLVELEVRARARSR